MTREEIRGIYGFIERHPLLPCVEDAQATIDDAGVITFTCPSGEEKVSIHAASYEKVAEWKKRKREQGSSIP